MLSPLIRSLVGSALVSVVGGVAVTHAVMERRRELSSRFEMAAMLQSIRAIVPSAKDGDRVIINGNSMFFRGVTVTDDPHTSLERVARECASANREIALGIPTERTEGRLPEPLQLASVSRQEAEGVHAVLCIFRNDRAGVGPRKAPRIRYALASRVNAGTTSVVSISTDMETSIEEMFPRDGDSPGGDFDGLPRPRDARRTLVASLDGRTVRMYETRASLRVAVRTLDEDMALAGLTRSAKVAQSFDDTRLYAQGDTSFVASFQEVNGAAVVTIAPLSKIPKQVNPTQVPRIVDLLD